MAKKSGSTTLFYADNFDQGWRTDVGADKLPEGALARANNVRFIPGGGFNLRRGTEHVANWVPATSYKIEQFGKCMEHDVLFVKSGTKILQTKSEDEAMYTIGAVCTAGYRGIFREYNSEMKYSNGIDDYLSITVGRVLTAFDQSDTAIVMRPGNTDMFRDVNSKSFKAAATGDLITSTGHGLSNGDRIAVYRPNGALPAGLSAATEYFVRNSTTDTFQVALTRKGAIVDITGTSSTATATADDATDFWTSSAHGLLNGDLIRFTNSGGTQPTGISLSTDYYVINKTTDTFQVSLTSGGSAVDMSDAGSGTHSWTQQSVFTTGIIWCKGNLITYTKKKSQDFTVVAATDVITSAAHNLDVDDIITVSSTGVLPGGMSAATSYHVIEATTDTFKLSATEGGASLNITDTGSGTHTFLAIMGGDVFQSATIPTGDYEAGSIVAQITSIADAPKGTVMESVFEKMVVGGVTDSAHAEHYSLTANITSPHDIDDFVSNGADVELFGKYGSITAMQSLLTKMYVAKDQGIEAWTSIDSDGIPVREPFDEAYGVFNHDCLIKMGNKLVMFATSRRIKSIEPDNTGANPQPIINPYFDKKLLGTLRGLDLNQDNARMGYSENDELMRLTAETDDLLNTIIYDAQTGGFAQDTGYSPACWIEWQGSMYFGDFSVAKIWKAETGFTDAGTGSPAMQVDSPIHFVGDRRRKTLVEQIFLTGLIKTMTLMTVEIWVDGELHRSVEISGQESYVNTAVFRPLGKDSIGYAALGRSGGEATEEDGFEFAVPLDVNWECRYVQLKFRCQGTGYGVQIDSYEGVAGEASSSNATQIEAI